jgi:hypothetical protein
MIIWEHRILDNLPQKYKDRLHDSSVGSAEAASRVIWIGWNYVRDLWGDPLPKGRLTTEKWQSLVEKGLSRPRERRKYDR